MATEEEAAAWACFGDDDSEDEAERAEQPQQNEEDAERKQLQDRFQKAMNLSSKKESVVTLTQSKPAKQSDQNDHPQPTLRHLQQSIRSFILQHKNNTCNDLDQLDSPQDARLRSILPTLLLSFLTDGCDHEKVLQEAGQVETLTWDQLQDKGPEGGWKHVCWREAFVYSQLIFATATLSLWAKTTEKEEDKEEHERRSSAPLYKAIKCYDMACIMGGPAELAHKGICLAERLIESVNKARNEESEKQYVDSAYIIPDTLPVCEEGEFNQNGYAKVPTLLHPILAVDAANMPFATFKENHYKQDQPVVIVGGAKHWPAFQKWNDLRPFVNRYGHRVVPIEIGLLSESGQFGGATAASHSSSKQTWYETTTTLKEFVEQFLVPSNSSPEVPQVGYLAQHALFDQFPELKQDYAIPPYTNCGALSNINAWLGTANTVTSLHFDSYDNILVQIAGFKYIRLYSTNQSKYLYTQEEDVNHEPSPSNGAASLDAQKNSTQCGNVEKVDVERFPLFEKAEYTECILGPGDMLFIPFKCWHYVRSLTTSFSASFWF
ncbi:Lysine-specific demethylase 8 [Balamuthia mandrillaris]